MNTAVVVGAGPGLGQSLVQRFLDEGYSTGMIARTQDTLKSVREITATGDSRLKAYRCDATDEEAVASTFDSIKTDLGNVDVLIYNAGAFEYGGILDLDPGQFEDFWKANCFGGFLTAQSVLPDMVEKGEGTIIFTGATASLRGSENFAGLAVGKFGLRALAQSMAREFGPEGIHVAHVIIDGQIDIPKNREEYPDRAEHTFLDPDEIAESYWQLHQQDSSAWTLELDLRPHVVEF
ncbi:MAG: SDR family NAD(P)-dependent oxidoreductase [bacterium]